MFAIYQTAASRKILVITVASVEAARKHIESVFGKIVFEEQDGDFLDVATASHVLAVEPV